MGYRMHYATKHIVNYEGGFFNHAPLEIAEIIERYCPEAIIYDNITNNVKDSWEIPRDEFVNMIKSIEKDYPDIHEEIAPNIDVEYFLDTCHRILANTKNKKNYAYPEYIYLSWF